MRASWWLSLVVLFAFLFVPLQPCPSVCPGGSRQHRGTGHRSGRCACLRRAGHGLESCDQPVDRRDHRRTGSLCRRSSAHRNIFRDRRKTWLPESRAIQRRCGSEPDSASRHCFERRFRDGIRASDRRPSPSANRSVISGHDRNRTTHFGASAEWTKLYPARISRPGSKRRSDRNERQRWCV